VPTAVGRLAFTGEWRRYQTLALEAFERDVEHGRRSTHIVAPPGSGKTLLGIEIVRRLGHPALVLAPNTAIQGQWLRAAASFGPHGPALVGSEPGATIACLTYQSLAQLDDPDAALAGLAQRRWDIERARTTGRDELAVGAEAAAWTGAAAERRRRQLTRIVATLKREIARGQHDGVDFTQLLGAGARERIAALRRGGVATVVLDECHHLASMWGYVVRAMLEELGETHVIGLTATPPGELTGAETELYDGLLGPVDFEIPTPAVVKDGYLAPYQELAWITEPLASELDWLADHDLRFQELVTGLLDEDPALPHSLGGWVILRVRERSREAGGRLSWAAFERAQPKLALAGLRFLGSAGLAVPREAPRGERYRQQPDLEDWITLIEDYALRCLAADASPAAAARHDAIAAALREFGFTLTRQGVRRGTGDVDRVLTASAAKPLALVELLGCEIEARGTALRAVVLADAELAAQRPDAALREVLEREAGTAIAALRALAGDVRTAPLRPLLVTGRGVRCAEPDAGALTAALRAQSEVERTGLDGWRWTLDADGLAAITAAGPGWSARTWVGLAGAILAQGATQALVGTRALLGEGWDAPCVNCLVDMTVAATSVSVRQMRGRSLRLDPADPEKISSNWDIVCIAPGLARGSADYRRFVRKHVHLHAPTETGEIESGPSHVHPELSPFAAPPGEQFAPMNRDMRSRAAAHATARERWRIGEPYLGEEHRTVLLRARDHAAGEPQAAPPGGALGDGHPPRLELGVRLPRDAGAAIAAVSVALAAAAGAPVALVGLLAAPAAIALAGRRAARAAEAFPVRLPVDRVARAICDAYVVLGELREEARRSLAFEPRSSGFVRVYLAAADAAESARFAVALEQALGPPSAGGWWISRPVAVPRGLARPRWRQALAGRAQLDELWIGVPHDLGRRRDRREAYAAAWTLWLGRCELRRDEEGAVLAAEDAGYDARLRDLWV
jgi:superfamily II DNA or RNA helicase